jgi:hypothetical protein
VTRTAVVVSLGYLALALGSSALAGPCATWETRVHMTDSDEAYDYFMGETIKGPLGYVASAFAASFETSEHWRPQ